MCHIIFRNIIQNAVELRKSDTDVQYASLAAKASEMVQDFWVSVNVFQHLMRENEVKGLIGKV
jgi:hypothetical protein